MEHGLWLRSQVEQDFGLALSDEQLQQFATYYEQLIMTNRQLNLTAITEPKEVYIKHFYDSLSVLETVNLGQITSIIDVGTGAGFPGIPLKIAFPHLKLVLVDSLQKRVNFLQRVTDQLGLTDVTCVHGRAEEVGHQVAYREQFELVVARAVAKLNVLAEYCLPFAKVDGYFVAMKGSIGVQDEITVARQALKRLGKAAVQTHAFTLPAQQGERQLICLHKQDHTPRAYPRKAGTPKKQPL